MAMVASDLDAWIRTLRRRLESGELAALGPIDVGYGTGGLPADVMIKIMLSDLDDLDDALVADPDELFNLMRRQSLLDELRRLRDVVG